MKSFLLAGSALLAMSAMATSAIAADTGGNYDWSGFYAGINAGALINNSQTSTKVTGSESWINNKNGSSSNDSAAFTGGGLLGYNWQIDKLVLGIETDVNYGGFSGSDKTTYTGLLGGGNTNSISYQSDWFGTLRGRAGYAVDNVLLYGTAGLAYGEFDTKSNFFDGARSDSNWIGLGWTAGAGIEYGIDKWSLGLEYLYVDLGSTSNSLDAGTFKVNDSVDYRFSVVRATAKYNF